jgi:dTMP kinase
MIDAGKLIVFEGPDGVGKSSLAQWCATHLQDSGTQCTLLSFPGREPGTLGHHVYELHHSPARYGINALSEAGLQLLHVAAHIDAIEIRIKPLLARGTTVVLDRFWWSTYGYGLVGGVSQSILEGIIALERSAWHPIQPDRLFAISRNEPLRPEPPELWPQWRDAYSTLAEQEAVLYPITTIRNEGTLESAQGRIVESA